MFVNIDNVSGRRSRQLLRNIEHTGAVNGFMAALIEQARSLGWEIVQLDPPIVLPGTAATATGCARFTLTASAF